MAKNNSSAAFPFLSILTLIFITLKLIDKINWSWWWVLSPLWAPLATYLIMFAGVYVFVSFQKPKATIIFDKTIDHDTQPRARKSKFMQKLHQAMEESEKKRNQKPQ